MLASKSSVSTDKKVNNGVGIEQLFIAVFSSRSANIITKINELETFGVGHRGVNIYIYIYIYMYELFCKRSVVEG